MGIPADTESMVRCIAKGLESDPDEASAKERAGALIGGAAFFMARRYGPHKAAEHLYRMADLLACEPDEKERRK